MAPVIRVVVGGLAGALCGIVLCVVPATFGYGDPGRRPMDWLVLGWPGVWVICVLGAGLITLPFTFLVFALWGTRYSGAEPYARRAYREANAVHPEPDHDREMGMAAGTLAGALVCVAVPPLLRAWSTAPPEAVFRGNGLAALLVTGSIVAGIAAKLAFLELQLWRPEY